MIDWNDFYERLVVKSYYNILAEKGEIPRLKDVHEAAMFSRHNSILESAMDFYRRNFYGRELRRLEAMPIIDEKDAEICGTTVSLGIEMTYGILDRFHFSYLNEDGWPFNIAQCNLIEVITEGDRYE